MEQPNDRKVFSIILLISIGCVAIVLGSYIYYFNATPISQDPEAWGLFGDYLGGVLGAIFAFLGFMALLWTVKLQIDTLQLSEETNRMQREYLDRKEKKEEWLCVIQHAEKQINEYLQLKVSKYGRPSGNVAQVINTIRDKVGAIGKNGDRELADKLLKEEHFDLSTMHLSSLAQLFEALLIYLENYKKYLVEKDEEIIEHYISSYIGYISGLQWMGVITNHQMKLLDKLRQTETENSDTKKHTTTANPTEDE